MELKIVIEPAEIIELLNTIGLQARPDIDLQLGHLSNKINNVEGKIDQFRIDINCLLHRIDRIEFTLKSREP